MKQRAPSTANEIAGVLALRAQHAPVANGSWSKF
jgi:hypothetical protein